jgi:hypothetical protein
MEISSLSPPQIPLQHHEFCIKCPTYCYEKPISRLTNNKGDAIIFVKWANLTLFVNFFVLALIYIAETPYKDDVQCLFLNSKSISSR